MEIEAKMPGPTVRMKSVKLDFNYKDFGEMAPATGYETLLYDCMVGDMGLFHRADMVEAAWSIATPILDVWKSLPGATGRTTPRARWGPASADQMLEKDGRQVFSP